MNAFSNHVLSSKTGSVSGNGLDTPGDRLSTMSGAPNTDVAHVLGMTVSSNSALTSSPTSGVIAYPAGSMLILLDSVKNKQTSCIICPGKTISALNFSPDGKLLIIGESGHKAQIRVWRVATMQEVANFGQFMCIECVSFTPTMREIVVVGNTYDMIISVWSWPGKAMLSLNKISDNVSAMSVANDGSYFVTVGNRHIKFYCLELPNSLGQSPIPLPTKSVVLDVLTDTYLCDVICGKHKNRFIFALSASGVLCQIGQNRLLERWANVGTSRAHCLATDDEFVFVGCKAGEIRMFTAFDLQLVTRLPQPHSLGVDIAQYTDARKREAGDEADVEAGDKTATTVSTPARNKSRSERRRKIYFPSVKAMVYDKVHSSLAGIYDDCSLYIWKRAGNYFMKRYSSLFHCGCIWDFTIYPLPMQEAQSSDETQGGALPPGSLITVSADGTLRSWDVTSNISVNSTLKRNPISSACLKIVYANVCRHFVPDGRESSGHGKHHLYSTSCRTHGTIKPCLAKEGRDVLSVVAVCHEGFHIATGNRRGQICIYDAYTMETLTDMVAHEAEVTVISYTNSRKYKILASGSRDRMIHLMDATNNYELMSTLDDHSSTITAIHFTYVNKYLIMVSSSLDMSVLARTYINDRSLSFSHVRAIVEKKAVVDFTLHPWSGQIALVCQDKMVHIKNISKSQESYSYRGCTKDGGQLVKISTDPSGLYILTACTKKTINLIEFETGEILKTFWGHAEGVTRVQFSLNMKYVISSSSDGCIFFWRLPVTVAYSVKLVMAEMGLLTRGMVLGEQWKKSPQHKRHSSLTRIGIADLEAMTSVRDSSSCSALPSGLDTNGGIGPEISDKKNTSPSALRLIKSECEVSQRPTADLWGPPDYGIIKDKVHPLNNLDACDKLFDADGDGSCRRYDSLDTLMMTCCRRRELFKLEAQSIKRVLTMMRLVADAMEKDLQDGTFPALPTNTHDSIVSSTEDANHNKAPTVISLAKEIVRNGRRRGQLGTHGLVGMAFLPFVESDYDCNGDNGDDVEEDDDDDDEDDDEDYYGAADRLSQDVGDNITQGIASLADYLVREKSTIFREPLTHDDRSLGSDTNTSVLS